MGTNLATCSARLLKPGGLINQMTIKSVVARHLDALSCEERTPHELSARVPDEQVTLR